MALQDDDKAEARRWARKRLEMNIGLVVLVCVALLVLAAAISSGGRH